MRPASRPLGSNDRKQGGTFTRFINPPKTEPSNRADAALRADHPAVVNGTTLFPNRVFEARDRNNLLIPGHNNAKLGSHVMRGSWKGMPIFSFALEERATCPRSCAVWAECYGNSLPMAVRFRYTPELMQALEIDLQRRLAFSRGIVVRLHTLGDFPDLDYLARWEGWMRTMPKLHVWGYTAHGPETPLGQGVGWMNSMFPGRWAFRYSVPPTALPGPLQATTTWEKPTERNRAAGGIICPAETGEVPACGKCGMCWEPAFVDRRITFLGHGMSHLRGKRPKTPDLPPGPPRKPGRPRKHPLPAAPIPLVETENTGVKTMKLEEQIKLVLLSIKAKEEVIRTARMTIRTANADIERFEKEIDRLKDMPPGTVFASEPVPAEYRGLKVGRLPVRGKDGVPSVTAQMQRHADQDVGAVPIDLDTALEWGRRNKVKLTGDPTVDWGLVQARRIQEQVPPYKLVPLRGVAWEMPNVRVGGTGP